MSTDTTAKAADAFNILAGHCIACHSCRATPDRMCHEAQQLYRVWKAVWKEHLHRDLRKV